MNKKSLVMAGFIALIGIVGMSMATNSIDVPTAVKNAFTQKFPDAQKVEWELEEVGEYEAEFKLNGEEMSANFKEDGTWVGTETEIAVENLPQAVKEGITATFPDHKIEEVEYCDKSNGITVYEVELENEKTDTEFKAVFSADGKFIKKEIEEEDENE